MRIGPLVVVVGIAIRASLSTGAWADTVVENHATTPGASGISHGGRPFGQTFTAPADCLLKSFFIETFNDSGRPMPPLDVEVTVGVWDSAGRQLAGSPLYDAPGQISDYTEGIGIAPYVVLTPGLLYAMVVDPSVTQSNSPSGTFFVPISFADPYAGGSSINDPGDLVFRAVFGAGPAVPEPPVVASGGLLAGLTAFWFGRRGRRAKPQAATTD